MLCHIPVHHVAPNTQKPTHGANQKCWEQSHRSQELIRLSLSMSEYMSLVAEMDQRITTTCTTSIRVSCDEFRGPVEAHRAGTRKSRPHSSSLHGLDEAIRARQSAIWSTSSCRCLLQLAIDNLWRG